MTKIDQCSWSTSMSYVMLEAFILGGAFGRGAAWWFFFIYNDIWAQKVAISQIVTSYFCRAWRIGWRLGTSRMLFWDHSFENLLA